jgi:hypothetical protein
MATTTNKTVTVLSADDVRIQSEDVLFLIRSRGFDLLPKSLQNRIWREFDKLNKQFHDLTEPLDLVP